LSEASIGNVGMNPADVGWVDLVWTPVGSVLWTIGEDMVDKYALAWVEKHVPFMMAKAAARMILNPSRHAGERQSEPIAVEPRASRLER
jgi:hypothetical protein